jgi:hypothetical protein
MTTLREGLEKIAEDLDTLQWESYSGREVGQTAARWIRKRLEEAAPPAPQGTAEPAEPTVEIWRGERKVTIYPYDTVLRIWGVNVETEMSEEPHTLASAQAAMDWLYEAAPPVTEATAQPADLTDERIAEIARKNGAWFALNDSQQITGGGSVIVATVRACIALASLPEATAPALPVQGVSAEPSVHPAVTSGVPSSNGQESSGA